MELMEMSCRDFVKATADSSPAPGGGSAAALAGVLAASLTAMVARLTLGKERYQENWEAMEQVRGRADSLAKKLGELVDLDTEAYNRVAAAFKLPKETPAQKEAKQEAIQAATIKAALVPLETLRTVERLLEPLDRALELGNPNCLTDAGVAAQLLKTAALGAGYNVRINLSVLKDQSLVSSLSQEVEELTGRVRAETARLEKLIEENLAEA